MVDIEVKVELYSMSVHEWLVNYVGRQDDKWKMIFRWLDEYHRDIVIVFKNEADATAFKLMYG